MDSVRIWVQAGNDLSPLTYSCQRRRTFACVIKPHGFCAHLGTDIADRPLKKKLLSPWPGGLFAVATSHAAYMSAGRGAPPESDGAAPMGQGSIHRSPSMEHFDEENYLSLVASVILIHNTNCGAEKLLVSTVGR